jgi:phage terminase large subunit GpA-like protein
MTTATLFNDTPRLFYPFRFFPAERKVFARKEDIAPSTWNERNRIVTIGAHRGPWRNAISPHLAKIMDTAALPWVREVTICKSPQTGGTEVLYSFEAYSDERDPAVSMFIMPSQADARKIATDRIIPMIEQTPCLKDLTTGNPDDLAGQRIKLRNGQLIFMAWSNSASALATFPVKRLYFDEIDKYPPFVGKETDPITLGEKRARTYRHTYKMFKVSTPTREDGPVWVSLNSSDVIYKWHVPCFYCGEYQEMTFDRLTWPQDIDAETIQRLSLARYICKHCNAQWTDTDRDIVLPRANWLAVKGADIERPHSVGFHQPSFVSADVSLSEIAAAYIRAKNSRAKLIDFYNDYLAMPFTDDLEGETVKEDVLYKRRQDYGPEGATWQVPAAACLLTCFVDVQGNRLEAEVVAWGEGYESWGIDHKILPGDPSLEMVWKDLDEYLLREWTHETGLTMRLSSTGIDSGYKGPEVYRFVRPRQTRRISACKGVSTVGKPLLSAPSMRSHRKTIAKQKKVVVINIGTDAANNTIYSWMQIEEPGPGYMHWHMGYSYDYFRQLCSEKAITVTDKAGHPVRKWVKKREDVPNEALDIRRGNYAMIELLQPNWARLKQMFAGSVAALRAKPVDPSAPAAAAESKPAPQQPATRTIRRVLSKGIGK